MNPVDIYNGDGKSYPVVQIDGKYFMLVNESTYEYLKSSVPVAIKEEISRYLKSHSARVKVVSDSEVSFATKMLNRSVAKTKVASTTTELSLPAGWSYINDVVPEEAVKHVAVVKFPEEPDTAVLFVSTDVSDKPELKDHYRQVRENVHSLSWAKEQTIRQASSAMVEWIYTQKKRGITSIGDNKSEALSQMVRLLITAIERRATDIHIYLHSNTDQAFIEFRIDKWLNHHTSMNAETLSSWLRALFLQGSEDPNNSTGFNASKAQKTEITLAGLEIHSEKKDYTIRWQSLPIGEGSKITLRLLDNDVEALGKKSFSDLGYEDSQEAAILAAIGNKKGFVCVSGTTGSGKTTSNSKMLLKMREENPSWSYCTLEDPIEIRLPGFAQVHITEALLNNSGMHDENKQASMAVNKALAALMRMDPDVVGVGEIRDNVMADATVHGVNTGHKFFATIHADGALNTFERLIDIGISRSTCSRPKFFSLIISQTLLPLTCKKCHFAFESQEAKALCAPAEYERLKIIYGVHSQSIKFRNPNGCSKCNQGISGMTVCAEVLVPDNKLLQLIRSEDQAGAEEYWLEKMEYPHAIGCEFQGKTMADHAAFKVAKGIVCPLTIKVEALSPLDANADEKFDFLKHLKSPADKFKVVNNG